MKLIFLFFFLFGAIPHLASSINEFSKIFQNFDNDPNSKLFHAGLIKENKENPLNLNNTDGIMNVFRSTLYNFKNSQYYMKIFVGKEAIFLK